MCAIEREYGLLMIERCIPPPFLAEHDSNVTLFNLNNNDVSPIAAEIAPPHPSTHTHDTNDVPVRLNEEILPPISNAPPSPLSRRMLLMVDAGAEKEKLFRIEKRGEDVRVNVCICVLSTLISPPVMLNGEDERE